MMGVAGYLVGSTTGSEAACLRICTEELPLNVNPVPCFQMYLLPFYQWALFPPSLYHSSDRIQIIIDHFNLRVI